MSRLIEILSEGTDRKLNNPSVRLLRTKYVVKEFPLEGMLFQISPLLEEALVFPKKRPCNSRKGLVVRPSSEWYPCWQQGQTGLAQQSVNLSQSSPQNLIRHCFFYRFFFFFFLSWCRWHIAIWRHGPLDVLHHAELYLVLLSTAGNFRHLPAISSHGPHSVRAIMRLSIFTLSLSMNLESGKEGKWRIVTFGHHFSRSTDRRILQRRGKMK